MADKVVLDSEDIRRTLVRIAHEIVERTAGEDLAIVGIHRRGAVLAGRLHALVEQLLSDAAVPLGDIDISFYRDDIALRATPHPVVHASHIEFPLEGATVVLVDDVLYTGRTVRAALDALIDFGRPKKVMLAVLVDRGHRELPIHADVIGKTVPTDADEVIKVKLVETDDEDEVLIMEK